MAEHDIVVIGASAGGVETLTRLVHALPADFCGALFVVLHLPAESPSLLPQILSRSGPLKASHPYDGEPIAQGHIYVAPPDYHLLLEQGYLRVVRGPKENRHRPAIDPLFRSAARAYGVRAVGVVLSGMLDDGTAGLMALKRCGGIAIVQDPVEALYPSMPQSALMNVNVDYCVQIDEIGPLLTSLAGKPAKEQEASQVTGPLEKEVRIAEMQTNTFQDQGQIGMPSVYSCPECGGVLWEIRDGTFLRFRGRTGHALSAENVLAEQTEVIDKALWSALKTVEEKISLSQRLAEQAQQQGHTQVAQRPLEQIQQAQDDAECLRHILLNPPLQTQQSEQQRQNRVQAQESGQQGPHQAVS